MQLVLLLLVRQQSCPNLRGSAWNWSRQFRIFSGPFQLSRRNLQSFRNFFELPTLLSSFPSFSFEHSEHHLLLHAICPGFIHVVFHLYPEYVAYVLLNPWKNHHCLFVQFESSEYFLLTSTVICYQRDERDEFTHRLCPVHLLLESSFDFP